MNKLAFFVALLCLLVLRSVPSVFAQDAETALPPADEAETSATAEPAARAGQEVEINEDTYRQFMELKDAKRQGDMMPEDAFKPGTGLQKLEKLPEESQKHLRNELREIIVQGDPWQPGDEESEYPYVPSPAAGKDPSLQKQEQEAWGELVDSYHQREAQIYANSAKSSAAMGSQDGSANKPGDGENTDGDGEQNKRGKEGQQAGQESSADPNDGTGTYSPNTRNDPNARSSAGVSQNAMEFLQGLGKAGSDSSGGGPGSSEGNGGRAGSPESPAGDGQALGQDESQAQAQSGQQDSATQSSTNGGTANPSTESSATSTAGTSQNALEFLKGTAGQSQSAGESGTASSSTTDSQGENSQASSDSAEADVQQAGQGEGQEAAQADGQQAETTQKTAPNIPPAETSPPPSATPEEESTAGASQNALEYLTGDSAHAGDGSDNEADASPPEGTLNIQDLLNAQGVGSTTGRLPESNEADDKQNSDDNPPEKDSDGL